MLKKMTQFVALLQHTLCMTMLFEMDIITKEKGNYFSNILKHDTLPLATSIGKILKLGEEEMGNPVEN